jgi:predicted dehydrogenase
MSHMRLALIGGGRWGRQYASVLARFPERIGRVLWVSHFNKPLANAFVAERAGALPRLELLPSLEAAILERPDAAIVVTASSDHASTAERLVRGGIPTLVEKPFALGSEQARRLIELARENDVPLCAALHLLKADFLQQFRELCACRRIGSMRVEWLDPECEERWGEVKSVNLAAYKAEEAVPHAWSILHLMLGGEEARLCAVHPRSLGAAEVEVEVGATRAVLVFGRRAAARRRHISVVFGDGGSAELDFTIEPGRAIIDGSDRPLVRADVRVGPLAAQLREFLDFVAKPPHPAGSYSQVAERCLGSVELMEAVRDRLVEEEAHAAAARLASVHAIHDPDISSWIVDNVVPVWETAEIRVKAAIQEVAGLAVETFKVACDMAPTGSSPSEAGPVSPVMISTIRASRFFIAFKERYAAMQGRVQ